MEKKSDKDIKLMHVWDSHALETPTYNPSLEEVKNDPDFIYQKLKNYRDNKNKKRVLDVGCGIGQYATGARVLGFNAEGIDISPKSVEIGRKRGEKITLGDMRKMPFKDEQFDIIIAGGNTEHVRETEMVIREYTRVLKKNGILIGNVPHKYSFFVITKKIQQMFGIWKCGYEKSFSMGHFRYLLEKNGFEVLELRRKKMVIGKHKFISGTIKLLDYPLWLIGLGGPHMYFLCRKKS